MAKTKVDRTESDHKSKRERIVFHQKKSKCGRGDKKRKMVRMRAAAAYVVP
jgi:hypothetical protein